MTDDENDEEEEDGDDVCDFVGVDDVAVCMEVRLRRNN